MSDLENYLLGKEAETSGTHVMPAGAPTYTDRNRSPTKTIRKVGSQLGTCVDVTGKEAPRSTTKVASRHALPSLARYPLDSLAHVKMASAYFDDNYKSMAPEHRREYCFNLCQRAGELGVELSKTAQKYGAKDYARDSEIEIAMLGRSTLLKEASHREALVVLEGFRPVMAPDEFAVALGEFDKVAGIDHLYDQDILDPYYTTYGEKLAEDTAIQVDNEYIPVDDLERFAKTDAYRLKDAFGEDFVDEFRKDPVSILKSLPKDQKKMVIRLASSTLTDPTST